MNPEDEDDDPQYGDYVFGGMRLLLPFRTADSIRAEQLDIMFAEQSQAEKDREEERYADPEPVEIYPPPVKKPRRKFVQVFDKDTLHEAENKNSTSNRDDKRRISADIASAARFDGMRELPSFRGMSQKMGKLADRFPNFQSVIDGISEDFALTTSTHFCVSPALLDGVPGIGKTAFSQALAAELGVPFLKLGGGSLQHPGQICGLSGVWGNSGTGQIFDLFANNNSAVAILLLDEVDKIPQNNDHPVFPILLDLLEPETSRRFRDESLLVNLDASRLIVLMTSNSKDSIDPALLSRARTFNITDPTQDEKIQIAIRIHAGLVKQTRKKLELNVDAIAQVLGTNGDLRELSRAIRSGFARAIIDGKKVVSPVVTKSTSKQRIGF